MTMRLGITVSLLLFLGACSSRENPQSQKPKAPVYDNVGAAPHPITTSSADAQKYFNQGLALSFAFNHAEAIRAFQAAAALDPSCAMCYWGVAFALGPNINAPITEDAAKQAFQAIKDAQSRGSKATDNERAYIEALSKRYAADPRAERAPLDSAYAAAMRDVVKRFPNDLDAAALFAQSLMDTSPWNYWNHDGSPREFTNEVISTLESVLARKADHVGAIHLYIHAVEASPDPDRASRYADRLPALAPGAGHLVHMPAHVYLRTGRYGDASNANQNAIKADEAYFAGDAVPGNMMYQVGYLPHNFHFFVTSASMEGRRADALQAADQVRKRMPEAMLRDPAMSGMVQHFWLTPLFAKMRFGMWKEVLTEPAPADDLKYMSAIWHAVRGMAAAAEGRMNDARSEVAAAGALKADPSLKMMFVSNVNPASSIASIAYEIASAELARTERRSADVVRHYAAAVALEDGLTYMEPPDWPIPVRELQGRALLEIGKAGDAEAAFRADLKRFPDNGWALSGLFASLTKQGRSAEAADVRSRLDQQWSRADPAARSLATN